MCKKIFNGKNGFRHFNTQLSSFNFPASARPSEVDRDQWEKSVWVSEWVVTCGEELTKNKQTKFGKAMRPLRRKNKNMESWDVPEVTLFVTNLSLSVSGKFKAWCYDKKNTWELLYFALNTFLMLLKIPKPQNPCWFHGHLKKKRCCCFMLTLSQELGASLTGMITYH